MIACLWVWAALAVAAEPSDDGELVEAFEAELSRAASELSLPDSPTIYHLRGKLMRIEQRAAGAAFGGLLYDDIAPSAALGVEVRVGDPQFDNTGFGGWQDGFRSAGLPSAPTAWALRQELWRTLDLAFKDAVEQYSRKQAQAVLPADHPGDYTLTGPVRHEAARAPIDRGADMAGLVERLSSVFAERPRFEAGEVHVGYETGAFWVLDTEGTRVVRPIAEVSVRAIAHLRTEGGAVLADQRFWTVRTPGALPDEALMRAEIEAMAEEIERLAEAPLLEQEYVGPVVFEGDAAADLFRWLLWPQLEGTPSEIPFETMFGEVSGSGGAARLGRRVLPPGWSVVDDPRSVPEHPGAYTHDWEGTPAQAVSLVEDGIVRRLLMSRVPRAHTEGSNGHGRGGLAYRAVGKGSLSTVKPPRSVSDAAMYKQALKLAASYGHDFVLVVRRLEDPATRPYDGSEGVGSPGSLPPPVAVYRVNARGEDELWRGARFAGVERWALRDIVAAGKLHDRDFLSSFDGDDGALGAIEGAACRMRAPSVLLGELEILPRPEDPGEARVLPPPTPPATEETSR